MGTCSSNKNKNNQGNEGKESTSSKTYQPLDTKVFSITELGNIIPAVDTNEPLIFHVKLSNFRMRSVKEKHLYFMKIIYPLTSKDSKQYTSKLAEGPNVKFNYSEEFTQTITYNELTKLKLVINFFEIPESKSNNIVIQEYAKSKPPTSILELDLLTLVIGPEHHDIQLFTKTEKNGRIIFDSSYVHKSNVKVEFKNIQVTVNNLNKKDICLRAKISNSKTQLIVTDFSFPLINANLNLQNKQISYSWIASKDDTIEIERETSFNEMKESTLQIIIFDTKKENLSQRNALTKLSSHIIDVNGEKHYFKATDQLGFAVLNTQSLLTDDSNAMTKQSSRFFKVGSTIYKDTFQKGTNQNSETNDKDKDKDKEIKEETDVKFNIFNSIERVFCEQIFSKNVVIGKIEGRIVITKVPLIKQIICGVHTEKGFDLSSHYLTMTSHQNDIHKGKQLKDLEQLSNKLVIKLTEHTSLQTVSANSKERMKQITDLLNDILKTIEFSIKDSCLFYSYKSTEDLVIGTEVLLDFGLKMLPLLNDLEGENKKLLFKILTTLLSRAEFDLSTFNCNLKEDEVDLEKRKDTIKKFFKLLNQLISYAIDKFSKKVKDFDTQQFVENIFAYSYFKSPKFRSVFLKNITSGSSFNYMDNNGKKLEETLNHQQLRYLELKKFSESDKNSCHDIVEEPFVKDEDEFVNPIFITIDWENLFYKKLYENKKNYEDIYPIINELDEILQEKEWQTRLASRGNGFLGLVKQLEDYIMKKIVVKRSIEWGDIPGFETIILVLISEIKKKSVSTYPDILKTVLNCFINDSEIINCFFRAIVLNTNANNNNAVCALFDIISSFFHHSENKLSNLKSNFDYATLKQCFIIILELDHSISVSKLLWFGPFKNLQAQFNFEEVNNNSFFDEGFKLSI